MLGRTNGVVRRGLRTEALTRLQLDIAAAQNAAQDQMGEPAAAVEKSPEAVRGESLRGDVRLPLELQEAVQEAIRGESSWRSSAQVADPCESCQLPTTAQRCGETHLSCMHI